MPAPATVPEYLAALPDDRRAAITHVRDALRARMPAGYEECILFGGISYVVPLSRLADTYNGKPLAFVTLASQKKHMALYLMCVYGDPNRHAAFVAAWRATGKKLDMGKACVRWRRLDDLALDVVGDTIAGISVDDYILAYRALRHERPPGGARPDEDQGE